MRKRRSTRPSARWWSRPSALGVRVGWGANALSIGAAYDFQIAPVGPFGFYAGPSAQVWMGGAQCSISFLPPVSAGRAWVSASATLSDRTYAFLTDRYAKLRVLHTDSLFFGGGMYAERGDLHTSRVIPGSLYAERGGFAYKSGELGVDVCKKDGFAYGVSEKCVTLRQISD